MKHKSAWLFKGHFSLEKPGAFELQAMGNPGPSGLESERVFSVFPHFAHVSFFGVLDLLAHAFILHLVQLREEVHDLLEGLIIDGILRPEPFPAGIDDVRLDEDLHMVGKGRLGQGEIPKNIARRELRAGEHIHNAKTGLIGERFENGGKFFVTGFVIHGQASFL